MVAAHNQGEPMVWSWDDASTAGVELMGLLGYDKPPEVSFARGTGGHPGISAVKSVLTGIALGKYSPLRRF
jgi:hypothetical protein